MVDMITSTLVITLACFWVVMAVTRSDGPFDLFRWLRGRYELFECDMCLSIWVGLSLAFIAPHAPTIINAMAVAGAVVLVIRILEKH